MSEHLEIEREVVGNGEERHGVGGTRNKEYGGSSRLREMLSYRDGICNVCPTLNNRGGRIGDLVVMVSYTPARTRRTPPTTTKAIVLAADPKGSMSTCRRHGTVYARVQVCSPKLKPIKRQTTPTTMRASPMKSNSRVCSRKLFPWWGLRFRKKNKRRPATPPVGLACRQQIREQTRSKERTG